MKISATTVINGLVMGFVTDEVDKAMYAIMELKNAEEAYAKMNSCIQTVMDMSDMPVPEPIEEDEEEEEEYF